MYITARIFTQSAICDYLERLRYSLNTDDFVDLIKLNLMIRTPSSSSPPLKQYYLLCL